MANTKKKTLAFTLMDIPFAITLRAERQKLDNVIYNEIYQS